ncbi:hypothetical protein ACFY3B_19300 [Micromonospora parva]|uniref:Uncharacterized protein n=1 Tax=Micromonospora parva TaxID=1464048 RepID=A0ABW6VVS9_9ACTN
MSENPKVQLDYPEDPFAELPEGQIDVRRVSDALGDLLGGEWGGWHRGRIVPDAAVWARFSEEESGRWVLSGLLVLGDAVKGETLRKVPVSVMENSHNLTQRQGDAEVMDAIADLPPLRREAGMTPEEFSQLVARHYRAWAAVVPSPVAAIAAEWKVKPPTVHTWIREARLRGFLPPARKGRPT